MDQRCSRFVLVLLLGAGMSVAAAAPAMAKEVVAEGDMQRYCQGRAAQKFHVSPRDIITLPVESAGNGSVVYGQYPPDGQNVTTFECHFGSNGKWKRVKLTGGGEESHDRGGDPVAEADMPRFCAGEASAAFGQRPQDILTLPLERDPGGYVVYGQYPPDGSRVTLFECHFNNQGVYQTVYEN